jgi:signal transduction histidine kinase
VSLRLKIVAAIAGLILVLGLAGTLHARLTLSGISEDSLEKRGSAIASDLESHARELLLTNDIYGLYRRINSVVSSNDDVRYVVIFGPEGDVKASTFTGGLPLGLRDANPVAGSEKYSLETLDTSDGSILDVARPVLAGEAGIIRVGLSREGPEGQVTQLTMTLLAIAGGTLLAGLVVAYGLATVLTRPLARLAEAARAVGRGELSQQVNISTRDEVGELAAAFNTMTQQLKEKEEDRSRLLEQVISAQEEERKRVARELHDEAGQALTSLMLGLKHVQEIVVDEGARAKAAELRAVASDTLDLMHDLSLELRPSSLDDLGLVAALERYVKDYARKYPINVDFHPGTLGDHRLPVQYEITVYRIVQEALTNTAKHADARNVSVTLEERNGTAVVVVEDDGCGFEPETLKLSAGRARRLGLLGMEERAALIGGRITIESRPGAGTAVFLEVPVERDGYKWNGPESS